MAVYVDDMYKSPMGRFGRMKMSHMVADTSEELRAMASLIGLDEKHIQHEGTPREHFDVSMAKRKEAVLYGAVELTMRELAYKTFRRRQDGKKTGTENLTFEQMKTERQRLQNEGDNQSAYELAKLWYFHNGKTA